MLGNCRRRKARWGATALFCAVFSFFLIHTQVNFAFFSDIFRGGWGEATPFIEASRANAASTKIFWGDGVQNVTIGNGPLYKGNICFVDPAVSPVAVKTLETGADFLGNHEGKRLKHAISVATFDASRVNMTNLRIGYIFYMKNGRIYLVDTSTLAKKQLSTETMATPEKLCEMEALTDWINPTESTITYTLKGTGGQCWDGTEVRKAVKLNATSTTAPTVLGRKVLGKILFDGRYLVTDFSTGPPWKGKICNKALTSCINIGSFTDWAGEEHFNASHMIGVSDGNLGSFKYTTPTAGALLYTPAAGFEVKEPRLDPDGFVYFMVKDTVGSGAPPVYTHSVNKTPVGGGAVTTLATFTTSKVPDEFEFDVSPSYVVFTCFPNTTNDGAIVRSVNKTGAPVVKTLTSASVMGGVVGSYFYFEDKYGRVNKYSLSGGTRITLPNALLLGASYGGKANWYYKFNTSAFRGVVQVGNSLKSFVYGDNIATAPGTVLGDIPVNLSNVRLDVGNDAAVGIAQRRGTNYSYETDVFFVNAAAAGSVVRLTNRNTNKLVGQLLRD